MHFNQFPWTSKPFKGCCSALDGPTLHLCYSVISSWVLKAPFQLEKKILTWVCRMAFRCYLMDSKRQSLRFVVGLSNLSGQLQAT